MDKSKIEFLVSEHEHKVNALHRIAEELESFNIPESEIFQILDTIQISIEANRKG